MSLDKPIKYLVFGLKNKAGTNATGQRVTLSKGTGRAKRKYRLIDFYRHNYKVQYVILRIEYDPNRSAHIALICYKNGFLSYIILTEGLKKGDVINFNKSIIGVTNKIKNIDLGTLISCVELRPNYGSKLARSAGCFCIIINRHANKTLIRLPSGEERFINSNSKATIGLISNIKHKLKKKKKAGDSYRKGLKPKVRGVAKNCVDHPSGGGRGKTSK
jgi:large subunit ribosomal protein L2